MESLHNKTLIVIAVGVLLTLWLVKVVRRAHSTSLRAIPGPWYAGFTQLWLKVQVLTGRRMYYIHDMHLKYGPVVRIAPNDIDVSDTDAFKEIHRIAGGFLKSPWYHSFRKGDIHDVFSMINPREHAQRRKLLAPLFSNSALLNNWTPVIVEKVRLTVEKIKREALQDGQVDILKWWTFMTADVISHLAFGEPFGMLDHEKKTEHMQKIEDSTKFGLVGSELPLARTILEWLPIPAVQRLLNIDEEVLKIATEIISKTLRSGISSANIFSKMFTEKEKDAAALSDYQLAFEASGLIVAGSGTTAVSLTYLVWAVLSNPTVQAKLEAEVGALAEGYTDAQLEALPYLSAVIKETLRIYGAAPGALPRAVPKGGANLAGYFLPEGTTVSTQAYTYHRDPKVYHEPEK